MVSKVKSKYIVQNPSATSHCLCELAVEYHIDFASNFPTGGEAMNEVNWIEQVDSLTSDLSDILVDGANDLADICETLALMDSSHAKVIQKALQSVEEALIIGNMKLLSVCFAPDEREEYLDNLHGYFNETTGTWYEQICANFKALTGLPANKWSALTWTIHLSLGHSTFDYLVHAGYIHQDFKGNWLVNDLKNAEPFGYDIDRINRLMETNFEELR